MLRGPRAFQHIPRRASDSADAAQMPLELHNLRRSRQISSRGRGGRAAVTRRPRSPCHQSGALLFPEEIVGMTCTTRYLYGHFTSAKPVRSVYTRPRAASSVSLCRLVPYHAAPYLPAPLIKYPRDRTRPNCNQALPGPTLDTRRRGRGTLTPATHRSRNGLRERTLLCFFFLTALFQQNPFPPWLTRQRLPLLLAWSNNAQPHKSIASKPLETTIDQQRRSPLARPSNKSRLRA